MYRRSIVNRKRLPIQYLKIILYQEKKGKEEVLNENKTKEMLNSYNFKQRQTNKYKIITNNKQKDVWQRYEIIPITLTLNPPPSSHLPHLPYSNANHRTMKKNVMIEPMMV